VIDSLTHSSDITMLMVTRQMRFAEEIFGRVVTFDAGCVVDQAGSRNFSAPTAVRNPKFLCAVLER